jgi:hypothetical protein
VVAYRSGLPLMGRTLAIVLAGWVGVQRVRRGVEVEVGSRHDGAQAGRPPDAPPRRRQTRGAAGGPRGCQSRGRVGEASQYSSNTADEAENDRLQDVFPDLDLLCNLIGSLLANETVGRPFRLG